MNSVLPFVPLLPLLGFLFNFTVGVRLAARRHGSTPHPVVTLVACGSVALAAALVLLAVPAAWRAPGHTLTVTPWTWIPGALVPMEAAAGTAPVAFQIDWSYALNPLSSVMALVVTLVGLLIHVYSVGYMAHDPGYARFMAYLNLFMFAMLTLVLAANYLVLFVGWEGVGLCSYLLIGFWFEKPSAADAGKKAFLVNRVGDAGFLLGAFTLFVTFGTLDFQSLAARLQDVPVESGWGGPLTLAALLLFLGACGKSAQLPLHVWLPDAMEGPTPVSALIHAATMVTAGVYMVARSSVLYAHAPNALLVVALVGAATAFLAATVGLVQRDIKRVLAYSTVSQLGFMFLALGVGAFGAAIFHLATHAFFKALLFLGAGSVIHALHGEQDLQRMGGLGRRLPITRLTMLVGCLAIAGIPFLAGFFSKDEILWSAFRMGGYGRGVWLLGLAAALMTAFYMFRLYHLTFDGTFRGSPEQQAHARESPPSMTVPLMALATGSALAGLLGVPALLGAPLGLPNVLERFLEPVLGAAGHTLAARLPEAPGHGVEAGLMVTSVLVALAGLLLARQVYVRQPALAQRLHDLFPRVHRLLTDKYLVDELYAAVFVRGLALGGGRRLFALDRGLIDGGDGDVRAGGGVNGLAWLTRDVLARASHLWDRYVVDGLVALTALTCDSFSYMLRAAQNGLVQHYALSMILGVFALIAAGRFVLGLF